MKFILICVRTGKRYEVVSYDPDTHRAVLHKEDGTVVVDPNFWPFMVKRAGYIMKRRKE